MPNTLALTILYSTSPFRLPPHVVETPKTLHLQPKIRYTPKRNKARPDSRKSKEPCKNLEDLGLLSEELSSQCGRGGGDSEAVLCGALPGASRLYTSLSLTRT